MSCLLATLLSLTLCSELARQVGCSSAAEDRDRVVRSLQGKSNPLVRPDGMKDGPVNVTIGYDSVRLLHLDTDHGMLKTTGYLVMYWTDRRLSFQHLNTGLGGDPYHISSVRLDSDSIWTPDIEVFNTDSPGMKSLLRKNMVIVYPNGQVHWIPMVVFNTFCDLPSDNHNLHCAIRLGSWTTNGFDLDLQVDPAVNMEDYWPLQGPWTLSSSQARREVMFYPCCVEPYVTVVYSFNFTKPEL